MVATRSARRVIAPVVVGASLLLVLTLNVLVYPDRNIPIVYAVPLLLAALWLPPRGALVISVAAVAANAVSIVVERTPAHVWPVTSLALVAICLFAYLLSRQRQATARLYEQAEFERERWRTTVESMLDPVTVADATGRAVYMNPAYSDLVGRMIAPDLSLEGHPTYSGLTRSDGAVFETAELPLQRAALRGEEVRGAEVVHRLADGGEFVGVFNASPLRDRNGRLVGAVAVGRDVTERKQSDEALRASEKRLKRAEEIAHLGSWELDLVPNRLTWSDEVYRIFGLQPQEFGATYDAFLERVHPDDRGAVDAAYADSLRENRDTYEIEHRVVRKSTGEIRFVHEKCEHFRDAAGRIVRSVGMVHDITERRQAEEALRESEDRLRTVIENLAEGLIVVDPHGAALHWNRAALEMHGYASLEDELRFLADTVDFYELLTLGGKVVPFEEWPVPRLLRGEELRDYELLLRHKKRDWQRVFSYGGVLVRDARGEPLMGLLTIRDVTQLAELDRAKDQFISVAAHELKTPVAIMKGYAEVLLHRSGGCPPASRGMLEAIDRGADRIDGIVRDLLDISQLHVGRLKLRRERVDLTRLAEGVVNRVASTAKRHRIRLVATEPVAVVGDRDRLEEAVLDLLDNAVRYSPEGGDVDVAVAVRDHEAVVSVRDQGVGIPKERQPSIFERFYRAHTGTPFDYGGMGVGLYISNEIVKRHGGRMWFESEVGKGSTFYFSLPS